jgi:cytochrome c oxidase subunit 2
LLTNTRNQIKERLITIRTNNKLEIIWTVIPAIALTALVGFGIYYWFKITGDAPQNAMQVEVTGSQFKWEFRYPEGMEYLGKNITKN